MLNPYFNNYGQTARNNEARLVHGYVTEVTQMFGVEAYYLPRQDQKIDKFFGEDILQKFDVKYTIEVFFETIDRWDGMNDMLVNYGAIVKDQATFHIPRWRFRNITGMSFPREGDLLYLKHNQTPNTQDKVVDGQKILKRNPDSGFHSAVWEIKFSEDEQQFYPHGEQPSFKIKVQLFNFSGEEFSTGISALDERMEAISPDNLQTLDSLDDLLETDNKQVQDESDQIVATDERNPWGDF